MRLGGLGQAFQVAEIVHNILHVSRIGIGVRYCFVRCFYFATTGSPLALSSDPKRVGLAGWFCRTVSVMGKRLLVSQTLEILEDNDSSLHGREIVSIYRSGRDFVS